MPMRHVKASWSGRSSARSTGTSATSCHFADRTIEGMTLPSVDVVTPTWERHDVLLNRAIPSVQAQTYPNVRHIVVSDGPDMELFKLLIDAPVDFVALPQH